MTDQTQGVFITDGLANRIQILDGNFPIIQGTDGNIIQLTQPVMSGGNTEGLTQVQKFLTHVTLEKDFIQGPVVQSIVSLTSLLVVRMLTILISAISNSQIFLLKKCE